MVRIWNAVRGIGLSPRAEMLAGLKDWARTEGCWYAGSAVLHFLAMLCLLLVPMKLITADRGEGLSFTTPATEPAELPDLKDFHLGEAPLETSELNSQVLVMRPAAQTEIYYDASEVFRKAGGGTKQESKEPNLGGLGGFSVAAWGRGTHVLGLGGVGAGIGTGTHPGSGGPEDGFGNRDPSGHRLAMIGGSATKQGDLAIAAALNWFYRHQESGGSWSLSHFAHHCKGRECAGASNIRADAGATALALLCFLAAGQTHKTDGPYRDAVQRAVFWLIKRQTSDGDLSAGAEQPMYSHGLATIALCEAYGMTKDPKVGNPAQAAVGYIERAQNRDAGSWRYDFQSQDGDTSVFGWQVMALKSAQMAGLAVSSFNLDHCKFWLARVAKGEHHGLFAYQPYREYTTSMTAVGLLCRQYLGAEPDAADILEGKEFLRTHPPESSDNALRDTYYWYYATQVMFNRGGPEWDQWNRAMRHTLIESQCKDGCAMGSWDPERPAPDNWSGKGGRIVTTAMSTLTLEVYYRYLPLYRLHGERPPTPGDAPAPPPVVAQNPGQSAPAATPPAPSHGIGL